MHHTKLDVAAAADDSYRALEFECGDDDATDAHEAIEAAHALHRRQQRGGGGGAEAGGGGGGSGAVPQAALGGAGLGARVTPPPLGGCKLNQPAAAVGLALSATLSAPLIGGGAGASSDDGDGTGSLLTKPVGF
jgi:hypothetical protein